MAARVRFHSPRGLGLWGSLAISILALASLSSVFQGAKAQENEHLCPADDDHKVAKAKEFR